MSRDRIPVAVVGGGNMGSNHLRVYDELPTADLVEVVEPDPERATEIRENYDARVVKSVKDITTAKAASITVPNHLHRAVAEDCLELGLDILVEKPLAMTVEDARAIADAAEEHGSILQVGHIERFNPAVIALKEILSNEELISLEARRLGPFNEHLTQESVVFDLMIHDLDVVSSLTMSDIQSLNAVGTTSRSDELDHAIATLTFENGIVASTTSSHVTNGKIRTLRATTKDAYIKLNYQEQELIIQRRGIEGTTSLNNRVGYRTETVTETPYIQRKEPLKNELEHFINCVLEEKAPMVDGADGIKAVELASNVVNCIDHKEELNPPQPNKL